MPINGSRRLEMAGGSYDHQPLEREPVRVDVGIYMLRSRTSYSVVVLRSSTPYSHRYGFVRSIVAVVLVS